MKKLFLGIFIGILSTIGVLTVFDFSSLKAKSEVEVLASSNNTKYIQVDYNISKILVNGVDTGVANSAFISSGVTYIPLRSIGEILNNTINWDQDTRTISITSNTSTNTTDNSTINTDNNNSYSINGEGFIGFETAKQIALERAGGGTIVSYGEELQGLYPKYIFIIYNNYIKYKIKIDAKTGDITNFENTQGYQSIVDVYDEVFTISSDEAISIALEKTGGGQVVKIERDLDNHMPEYKIEILKGNLEYKIEINGITGDITEFKMD